MEMLDSVKNLEILMDHLFRSNKFKELFKICFFTLYNIHKRQRLTFKPFE